MLGSTLVSVPFRNWAHLQVNYVSPIRDSSFVSLFVGTILYSNKNIGRKKIIINKFNENLTAHIYCYLNKIDLIKLIMIKINYKIT